MRLRALQVLAAVLAVALVAVALWPRRPAASAGEPVEFTVTLPPNTRAHEVAVSPDGRYLAVTASDIDKTTSALWVRPLDATEFRRTPELESPFGLGWSPDSRWITVQANPGRIVRVPVSGGAATTLFDRDDIELAFDPKLGSDGTVLIGARKGEILALSEEGGEPKVVLAEPRGYRALRSGFQFLPDGRRFLFSESVMAPPEHAGVYVGSLDGEPPARLLPHATNAVFAPFDAGSPRGVLLYVRDELLMARVFDADRLEFAGEPVVVSSEVGGAGRIDSWAFSISPAGVLAFGVPEAVTERQLAWIGRDGEVLERLSLTGRLLSEPTLSPAGDKVAYIGFEDGNYDVWLYDLERGSKTRLTSDPARERYVAWAPDGQRLVYCSYRSGGLDLYTVSADGSGERVIETTPETELHPDWSSDGRHLVFSRSFGRGSNLWVYENVANGETQTPPRPFVESTSNLHTPRLSPDGRYVAYLSNESGRFEVYVQPFPAGGRKTMASTGGAGGGALWRRDGKELIYVDRERWVMSAPVSTEGDFTAGAPKKLFQAPAGASGSSLSPDGRRFLMFVPKESAGGDEAAAPEQATVHVIVNWQARIRQLLEASGQQP